LTPEQRGSESFLHFFGVIVPQRGDRWFDLDQQRRQATGKPQRRGGELGEDRWAKINCRKPPMAPNSAARASPKQNPAGYVAQAWMAADA